MNLYPRRVDWTGAVIEKKSKLLLTPEGAKHFHYGEHLTFIPKGSLKKAIKRGERAVMGKLIGDAIYRYSFPIVYLPKGEVKIGCLILSRGQVGRAKQWLFGGKK